MEQLLKITTQPMEYKLVVHNARLEYTRNQPLLETSRNKGEMYVKSTPTKLYMDSFDARNSICPTAMESVRQSAQAGQTAAYEATADYAKEGALLLDGTVSNPLDQIIAQRNQLPSGDFFLKFIPTTGPNIQWSEPDLTMQYQADKLSFDLKVAKGDLEFTPGSIELSIEQMPDIQIDYIGDPIYVPPSAADFFNHVPVDVLA